MGGEQSKDSVWGVHVDMMMKDNYPQHRFMLNHAKRPVPAA
jgi:hypothetical protein